jgi:hypothetical protein
MAELKKPPIKFPPLTPEALRLAATSLTALYPTEDVRRITKPAILHLDDLMIRTKEAGQLVRLRPNVIQAGYLDIILPNWREDPTGLRGMREIILKGRQFGLSTLIMALFFLDTVQTPYTTTVIIAHDGPTTIKMFETIRRFYNHLPEDKKPVAKYDSKRELYWPELDSSIIVGQAGSVSFGAGLTINHVHCSETPRWPDAERLMGALQESVPDSGNIFNESTAVGYGNYYQKEWDKAYVQHDSAYKPRFFCWVDFPSYRINVKDYEERGLELPKVAQDFLANGPTEEERKLQELHHMDDEQLVWYKWKKQTLGNKVVEQYPFTPEEAFMATGTPFFDNFYLLQLSKIMESKDYDPIEDYDRPVSFAALMEHFDSLEVFEAPRADRFYVIGADTAEGLNDEGDHDYASAHVFDTYTWAEVAHFHKRLDPHNFGLVLADLGWWYRYALLGVERNNHGHSTINTLLNTCEYGRMDDAKIGGLYCHEEYDRIKQKRNLVPGWPTNPKTKFMALDFTKEALDDRTLTIRSRGTVQEMITFRKKDRGKVGAEKGAHDDRVTSLSIIAALLNLRPRTLDHPMAGGHVYGEVQDSYAAGSMIPQTAPNKRLYSPVTR